MKYLVCGRGFLGNHAQDYFKKNEISSNLFSSREFKDYFQSYKPEERSIFLNFSGNSSVEESIKLPEIYRYSPINQVKMHLDILSSTIYPPHYVFVSTASVYGETYSEIPDESFPKNPISPYSEGKSIAEDYLCGPDVIYPAGITVLRATSIFSDDLNARVLGRIREGIMSRKSFELYGHGDETRDFLHSDDFFRLIHRLMNSSYNQNGVNIYNIGSGIPYTIKEIVDIALKYSSERNPSAKVFFNGKLKFGDPKKIHVSIDKLRSKIDFPITNPYSKLAKYFS